LIRKNKFREDLYYRLNTVPIELPALRKRKEDVLLIFRKFAVDFSDKYRMPPIKLDEAAQQLMLAYNWPGNIRQLRNLAEQMSVVESKREIDADTLRKYLPSNRSNLPMVIDKDHGANDLTDRELLYKVLFDMKADMTQLKALVADLMSRNQGIELSDESEALVHRFYREGETTIVPSAVASPATTFERPEVSTSAEAPQYHAPVQEVEVVEESLSLADMERELIILALKKHNNKRKYAAKDLGISERTLYRKIKEYDID